jgi:Leucine-rich repeat (LRR) protein
MDTIRSVRNYLAIFLLSVDINFLDDFRISASMPRLRILRVSGNRLHNLDVGAMGNLRTLYADNNSLANLVKVDRLTKLENLSLRNQSGRGMWVVYFFSFLFSFSMFRRN